MDPSPATSVLAAWAARPGRAVVLDFNGTLSDDEPLLLTIFQELSREHLGRELTAEHYQRALAGLSDREIVERLVDEAGAPARPGVEELLRLRAERYVARVAEESPVRPWTVAFVDRLAAAGVPLAVVTGAQRAEVRHVLAHSPVGRHLAVVVTEEDVQRGKPDPEGFLTGARLLGCDPADALVLEDSVPGVRGALAAGMACLAVAAEPSAALRAVAPAVVPRLGPELLDGLDLG